LLDSNLEDGNYISAAGKDAIVIGGGDTGTDCVATSLRHGCKSLTQLDYHKRKPDEREPDNPWPQWPNIHQTDYGHKETREVLGKDPREFQLLTKKFIGDENGHVRAVQTVEVDVIKERDGSLSRRELPGTEKEWPAQLVLLSIGFKGPEQEILQAMQVEADDGTRAKAEYGKYRTSVEGVFAAGDVRRGQSLIVWAINEGREAARECDKYLTGSTVLP
jgi:glutamate synthase (NADPH) small chain